MSIEINRVEKIELDKKLLNIKNRQTVKIEQKSEQRNI